MTCPAMPVIAVTTASYTTLRDTIACPCGGGALELVGKTPRVGPYPELKTFRCSACGEVSTVESD